MSNQFGIATPYEVSEPSEEELLHSEKDKDRTNIIDDINDDTDLFALAEKSIDKICKMLDTGLIARQSRFEQIRKNEDMYNGNTPPALKGRSNVPFDCIVMGGFIDTLQASIDETVDLTFGPKREAATKRAKKMTALFKDQTGPDKGNLDDIALSDNFLASLSGRGFIKMYTENAPKFKIDFERPDHYDIVTEPQGGMYLRKHLFAFEMNIFRTKADLVSAARSGLYNAKKVAQLIDRYSDPDFKRNDDVYRNKLARFSAFGTDIEANSYVGQQLYRLVEGKASINGKWYYVLFSREMNTWIRFEPLEKVYPWAEYLLGQGGIFSWATHRHPYVFWTKAPADDIRAIGYTMKKIMNLTIDNLEKRGWDMKAYDPRVFTDPEKLLYKQDNLVRATLRNGQKIGDGIFNFQTPDTTNITINLMEYLDMFLGKKTGITDDNQGASGSELLGIQVNNIAMASKRLKLTNKQKSMMYQDLGCAFTWAAKNIREEIALKLIGSAGADWDEVFTKDDAGEDYTITARVGGDSEEQGMLKNKKQSDFFDSIENNPNLAPKVNASAMIRLKGRIADIDEDAIDLLLDTKNESDEDVMADAAQAIEDAIADRPMRIYNDASLAFIEKIINFTKKHYQIIPPAELKKMSAVARKEYKDDMDEHKRLTDLVMAHMPIAKKNATQDFANEAVANGMPIANPPATNRMSPQMMNTLQPGPDTGMGGNNLPAGKPGPVVAAAAQ